MKRSILYSIKICLIAVAIISTYSACKKLPSGFLSPLVRYEEDPIIIQKGRVTVSSALNFDGSSKPATITLLHIYNEATGALVDTMFAKKYTIKAWKALYDPKKDTTLELIAAKQYDAEVNPININPVSGQLEANFTTIYLPEGSYSFDLQITNAAGTGKYEKIGHFQLINAKAFEANPELGSPNNRMIKVGNESDIVLAQTPMITINRTADAPNKIIIKFVDKNGVAFNPALGEIIHRPVAGNNPDPPFWQFLEEYALKTEKFSDRMELSYAVTPFPLDPRGPGYNFYYRIPATFFMMDDQVKFPFGQRSSNPRFVLRVYVPGTYTVEVKMPDMVHR